MMELIPEPFRPVVSRVNRVFKKSRIVSWAYMPIAHLVSSRDEVHQYWNRPTDAGNAPQSYLEGAARSQFLVELIKRYTKPNTRVLEIGCNVGRNLNYLFNAGFSNLSGIEINEEAVRLLKQSFPEMADHIAIHNTPVEEIIRHFANDEFNIVFTMAVLEHIHTDSEWIFSEIVRITKDHLVTIEEEKVMSGRHFSRNYKRIFESLGMKQIEETRCNEIEGLGSKFYARVFTKC